MRIVYIITAIGVGGAENLLADLCRSFGGKHEITVIFFRDRREFEARFIEAGADVVYIPFEPKKILRVILETRKVVKKKCPDVIHTHLPLADIIGRIVGLSMRKVKVISSIHNSDPWKLSRAPWAIALKIFDFLTVNIPKRVRLIAVSESAKQFTIKHEWIRSKKIKVIYNFIEFNNPAKTMEGFVPPLPPDRFVLITVARLEPNKGHMLLFRAMQKVLGDDRFSHVRLLVMGGGGYEETLKEYVRDNELDEYIIFLGRHPNVYDYLNSSDLFVLASDNEGLSIAILESFFCRKPVLASDIESNVELLQEGERGILFRQGDADDLAQKIKSFAMHKYNTALFKRNGFEFCDNLTRERYILLLEEFMRAK